MRSRRLRGGSTEWAPPLDNAAFSLGPPSPGSSLRDFARVVGVPVVLAVVATASAPGWTTYDIKSGDTLTQIAAHFHVPLAKLIEVNALPGNGDLIYAGETLKIPLPAPKKAPAKKAPARKAPAKKAPANKAPVTSTRIVLVPHKIVLGDTLIGLAAHFHTAPAAIAKANHLTSSVILLGGTLKIPVKRTVKLDNSFAGRTYPAATVRAAAHNRALLAERKVPDKAHTRALIVATAKKLHVDPALALAVGWQESGWNQRRVSVANAIGIMQVIPSTGRWISSVVGRDLDLLDARENVIAGVTLLKVLTDAAQLPNAVAGYYQGLGSVRKNGMFADTRRYVDNILTLRKQYD
jgi:LysM repeat protein